MNYDEFDEPIRRLLVKAERIAGEELKIDENFKNEQKKIDDQIIIKQRRYQQDIEKLAEIRGQLGKLRIGRAQKLKKIQSIRDNIEEAKQIRGEFTEYFQALDTLDGDELVSAREKIIGDDWAIYGSMLEHYRDLVGLEDIEGKRQIVSTIKTEISVISLEISQLEQIESLLIQKIEKFMDENPALDA